MLEIKPRCSTCGFVIEGSTQAFYAVIDGDGSDVGQEELVNPSSIWPAMICVYCMDSCGGIEETETSMINGKLYLKGKKEKAG